MFAEFDMIVLCIKFTVELPTTLISTNIHNYISITSTDIFAVHCI